MGEQTPKGSQASNALLYLAGIIIAIFAGMGMIVSIQSFVQIRDTLNAVATALGV